MNEFFFKAIVVLVPMVLSLSVHEWAHALVATKLGDDTAKRQGRLTLSPEKHIDPIGSIFFPLIGVFTGFLFGWARPIPVTPTNFDRKVTMKTGMLLVALAGPASNLILALICAAILKGMHLYGGAAIFQGSVGNPVGHLLGAGLMLNVVLCVFNLAPVPPLDGSKILAGILPHDKQHIVEWLERNQFFVFILLLVVGVSLLSKFVMLPLLAAIVYVMGLQPVSHLISFGI